MLVQGLTPHRPKAARRLVVHDMAGMVEATKTSRRALRNETAG
jgi:hypothetical protein